MEWSQAGVDIVDKFGECWGELSGGKLNAEGVRAARAEEMGYASRYEAHKKVPVEDC